MDRTPIMHATVSEDRSIKDWVLIYGAFRGAKDNAGPTAMTLAAKERRAKAVEMLSS